MYLIANANPNCIGIAGNVTHIAIKVVSNVSNHGVIVIDNIPITINGLQNIPIAINKYMVLVLKKSQNFFHIVLPSIKSNTRIGDPIISYRSANTCSNVGTSSVLPLSSDYN